MKRFIGHVFLAILMISIVQWVNAATVNDQAKQYSSVTNGALDNSQTTTTLNLLIASPAEMCAMGTLDNAGSVNMVLNQGQSSNLTQGASLNVTTTNGNTSQKISENMLLGNSSNTVQFIGNTAQPVGNTVTSTAIIGDQPFNSMALNCIVLNGMNNLSPSGALMISNGFL
jgi:hypothetical protein